MLEHGGKSKSKRVMCFKTSERSDTAPDPRGAPRIDRDMCRAKPSSIGSDPMTLPRSRTRSAHAVHRPWLHRQFAVDDVLARRGEELCAAGTDSNQRSPLRQERDFPIDLRSRTLTCPAGQTKKFHLGQSSSSTPRSWALSAPHAMHEGERDGAARTIHIAEDEPLLAAPHSWGKPNSRRRELHCERASRSSIVWPTLWNKQGRRRARLGTRNPDLSTCGCASRSPAQPGDDPAAGGGSARRGRVICFKRTVRRSRRPRRKQKAAPRQRSPPLGPAG